MTAAILLTATAATTAKGIPSVHLHPPGNEAPPHPRHPARRPPGRPAAQDGLLRSGQRRAGRQGQAGHALPDPIHDEIVRRDRRRDAGEEGKSAWTKSSADTSEGTPADWNRVTIRHLLSHTSGIKDFINEPTQSLRLDVTEDEVFHAATARPLNFPTGDRYAYSNTELPAPGHGHPQAHGQNVVGVRGQAHLPPARYDPHARIARPTSGRAGRQGTFGKGAR